MISRIGSAGANNSFMALFGMRREPLADAEEAQIRVV